MVVVGAGAAGLTAASALARAGVEVLLVERRQGGSPLPRATVLSVRTMELMRSWGLEDRIRQGADGVEMTMLEAPTAARAAEGVSIDVGYPSSKQSAMVSPTEALCVAQDLFEEVLAESLAAMPDVTIQRGVEVIDVRTGAPGEGAVLTVRDAGGTLRTVETGYVVAADGARSAVRAALGIGMTGPDDAMTGIQVVFRAPLWDVLGEHRHLLYSLTDPEGSGTLLPAGQGDRWLYGLQTGYHYEPGRELSADEIRRRIERGLGVEKLDVRVERFGTFTSGAQLADTFRAGDVFLVGDAAHQGHTAWRHRPEHRHCRRVGPGLEARLGAARVGPLDPALGLRAGASCLGGLQRRALGRPARFATWRVHGAGRRPRGPDAPCLGGARRAVDARPAGAGADAVRGFVEPVLGRSG